MGDGGEDRRIRPTHREPSQVHPEDDQHHDGEPEDRSGGPADGEHPGEVIRQPVSPRPGEGAEADSHRDGDDGGGDR